MGVVTLAGMVCLEKTGARVRKEEMVYPVAPPCLAAPVSGVR